MRKGDGRIGKKSETCKGTKVVWGFLVGFHSCSFFYGESHVNIQTNVRNEWNLLEAAAIADGKVHVGPSAS